MQRPHHTFHSAIGSGFFPVVLKLLPSTVSPLAAAHVPFPLESTENRLQNISPIIKIKL
jgi:hypothetical protein